MSNKGKLDIQFRYLAVAVSVSEIIAGFFNQIL